MLFIVILFLATLFLAYANGANDNFKGVATLFGSQTIGYKTAIWWATITTFAGSLCSIVLASELIKNFSGKGLVSDAIANTNEFHTAVALAAGLTVILATITGFPISTTHGLTGALVGAGLMAIGTKVNFNALGNSFFLPLLLSPILAIGLGAILYSILHYLRRSLKIAKTDCICIGEVRDSIVPNTANQSLEYATVTETKIAIDTPKNCQQNYQGKFFGIQTQKLIDICHFISAGIVSFARGLNDTPKIVALLLIIPAISIKSAMLTVALGMVAGGLFNAKKVAMTMSKKITNLDRGQGLSANLITGLLVICASRFGLPVSTTHVSVGSIFGVGLVSKTANIQVFSQVIASWLLTLPIAAILSAIIYWIISQ
jgi:inorganic phosphate transporter, PiT family